MFQWLNIHVYQTCQDQVYWCVLCSMVKLPCSLVITRSRCMYVYICSLAKTYMSIYFYLQQKCSNPQCQQEGRQEIIESIPEICGKLIPCLYLSGWNKPCLYLSGCANPIYTLSIPSVANYSSIIHIGLAHGDVPPSKAISAAAQLLRWKGVRDTCGDPEISSNIQYLDGPWSQLTSYVNG